ncbi:MAG: hypothetical protein V2A63_02640 [Patescibacteria group bacterium]
MTEPEKNLAQKLFGVFELLRDSGKFPESGTAKMLREKNSTFFQQRAEEEFAELAGVVDGSHRHSDDFEQDFLLESSQVFYWLALASVVDKKSFAGFLENSAIAISRLEAIHAENKIPFSKIFEKDLAECRAKGYIA